MPRLLDRREPRFVGREAEVGALHRALHAACDGRGSLVLVGGEAGIGKTTLVHRIVQEARRRGLPVLIGQCYDLETTPPYGPWREVLSDAAADEHLPAPPPGLDRDLVGTSPSSPEEQRALVSQYVFDASVRTPLLLVLEDMHWADYASLDLLRSLARRLGGHAILLIATYRDLELQPEQPLYRLLPHVVREAQPMRIRLLPLEAPLVERLVRGRYRLPEPDRARLVAYLMETAEGNPFFIEELLAAREDDRILRSTAEGWELADLGAAAVPRLVRQVIAGHLARVSPRTVCLLQVAAVIGAEVTVDLWRAVVAEPDEVLAEAIAEACAVQVFADANDPTTLRFRHALIHQALYEETPLPRRTAWHRRVGEVLAARPGTLPDGPAFHYRRANDQRAIPWLIQAGDRARALYAPEAAVDAYTSAFALAGAAAIEIPAGALSARGQTYATLGAFERAREDLGGALALARAANDRAAEWQALVALSGLWSGRDYARSGEYCERALALARELGERALLARSLMWVGNWRLYIGQARRAVRHHEQALAVFAELDDQAGIAKTADMLAFDHLLGGDMPRAADYGQRTIAVAEITGQQDLVASGLMILAGASGVYEFTTEMPADPLVTGFRRSAEQAISLATDISWRSGEALARCAAASHLGLSGDYGPALTLVRRSLVLTQEIEHREWEVLARTVLGHILLDLLAWDEARQRLTEASERTSGLHSYVNLRLSVAPLARSLVATGETAQARAVLDPVLGDLESAETSVERGCWWARGELALAEGEAATALAIADHLIAATHHGTDDEITAPLGCLRAKALLALEQIDEVESTLDAAERHAVRFGFRSQLWRIARLREVALARQHRDDERRQVRAGRHALIQELAAAIADEPLRAQFVERALDGHPTPSDGNVAGLSAREQEVLKLAAQGLTNEAIADQLYISSRTVKGHLQSIYNKLGVSTRTAAAAFAFEHSLV